MERYVEIDGKNIKELTSNNNVVCCRLRNSRIKSKQLAIMEMLLMNYDLGLRFIKNGPLGDVKGIVSFFDVHSPKSSYIFYFFFNIVFCYFINR